MQNLKKMTEASRDSPVVTIDSSRFSNRTFRESHDENLMFTRRVDVYVLMYVLLVSEGILTHRTISPYSQCKSPKQ